MDKPTVAGIKKFDFSRNKYGRELLVDLIRLENLGPYLSRNPRHTLSYYDVTMISRGKGLFGIDDRMERIQRGRVFLSAPGQIRKWEFDGLCKGYVLIFEADFLIDFFNDSQFVRNLSLFNRRGSPSLDLDQKEQGEFARLFREMETEIRRAESRDRHLMRAILYHILALFNREKDSLSGPPPERRSRGHAEKFSRAVEAGYLENRSVEFYARMLCISPGHLNDTVKQAFGISAKSYIQDRVFLEAKRMLLHSDWTVDEIAARLRFPSPSYFVHAFRRRTQWTPLGFRMKKNP